MVCITIPPLPSSILRQTSICDDILNTQKGNFVHINMNMKFIHSAIATYRNYSSQSFSKATKRAHSISGSKIKSKTNEPRSPGKGIKWTDEQSQVLSAISRGQSVFITGSAGSGKSFLVKHIVKRLKEIHGPSGVFVTASTGIAACALNGQSLHSFAGVGLGMEDKKTLLHKVLSNKRAFKRWKNARALVIDEISMIDAELFEKLEYIASETRCKFNDKVWGGIQLVVSGDFFQLPPISVGRSNSPVKQFAFEADCWDSSFELKIELTTIFRQSDSQLIKLLQGIRKGKADPDDLQLLKQCCSEGEPGPSVVRLYPRIKDVNRVNLERMKSLGKEVVTYTAKDRGEDPWKMQLKHCLAPEVLELSEGARVMLIKNLDMRRKLVNGATGTIIDFTIDKKVVSDLCNHGRLPIVEFDSGKSMIIEPEEWKVMEGDIVLAQRMQIPLILAWSLSIHKCQGMTLDSLHADLSRAFGCGMIYVALSRVRSLEGLHLSGFRPQKIQAHPKVLQYYQSFASNQDIKDVDDGANMSNDSTPDLHNIKAATNNVGLKYNVLTSRFQRTWRQES